MKRRFKQRKGMTLIDVSLAVVVFTIGLMFFGRYFTGLADQLSPKGEFGGLRRYLMAEQMLKAQAEGLRVMRDIPSSAYMCKVVIEPPGAGYQMGIIQSPLVPAEADQEMYYFDLVMTHQGQAIGTLSMSTLRSQVGGQDDKIGL